MCITLVLSHAAWQGESSLSDPSALQVDEDIALQYQKVMAEWKACEVIVKQREKESHYATLAKFSSGSSIDSHVQRLIHRDSTISNDVSSLLHLQGEVFACQVMAEAWCTRHSLRGREQHNSGSQGFSYIGWLRGCLGGR